MPQALRNHGSVNGTQEAEKTSRHRAGMLMVGLGVLVALIDQLTKIWAVAALTERVGVPVIGDTVQLLLIRNSGAAFSFATDATPLLSALAAAVVLGLLWYSTKVRNAWWASGLGLVLGGAAGNLVDRLVRAPGFLHGHVVDFVSVGWWPIFNVADSALTIGVVVLAVAVVLGKETLHPETDTAHTAAKSQEVTDE